MNIVIGSMFRNTAGRHNHLYFLRMVDLLAAAGMRGDKVRLALVEGDSSDDTRGELERYAVSLGLPLDLITRNHGGPVYGSTEEPSRMQALSYVANGFMEAVRETDDVAMYVESDLIWTPKVFYHLADQLRPGVDVIAPLVFAGTAFYDIWGFRKSGIRFGPFEPFHHELVQDGLTEVDSVGSCLVMRPEVAMRTRMTDYALVQFCDNARAGGYHVWVDARERIFHP